MSRNYFLSRHSFACETGGHAIFLDLKRDMYSVVTPEDVPTLRLIVQGWPESAEAAGAESSTGTQDAGNAIEALIQQGLLTADASAGKSWSPIGIPMPESSLLEAPRLWPQLTITHIRRFALAWAKATIMLRTMPISWVIARARRRRQQALRDGLLFPVERARELLTIHWVLQPCFYSAKDACLRNSCTLIEFLAQYQIYPEWVFGVKVGPFGAHCWVQDGATLLTDRIAQVQPFTPIMSV